MKRLAAFTITELLVYMIIAGVVLLAVMEGLTLLNRYIQRRTEKIVSTAELYDGYRRFVTFVNETDSIGDNGTFIELFDDGELRYEINISIDSFLIVNRNYTRDTLFRRVIELDAPNDTITLKVLNDRDSLLQYRVAVIPDERKISTKTIEDKENEYRYE